VTQRVAVITCRGDEVDPDSPILLAALHERGVEAELVVWDDADVQWEAFNLNVLRSTWDYAPRRDEFVAWASTVPSLVNPAEVVAWNTDKHYLGELERKKLRVIPTTFANVGVPAIFPTGDFVVKPAVGAGSMDAERYDATQHGEAAAHVRRLHDAERDAVIQPYVASVDDEGELALVYVEGRFVHAMRKGAMLNATGLDRNALFRREQMTSVTAPADAVDFADRVLAAAGYQDLLYARVDLVRDEGGWSVMELELTEPSLFLSYSPEATAALADAIVARASAAR
jgi:glutathione synthase/RimK-type ligase-like ATP-grasp enzyme